MHATALHEEPPTMFTNSENLHGISIAGSAMLFNRFLVKQLWIHNEFLDSRYVRDAWVLGFTMGCWIHGGFLASRWVFGFTKKFCGSGSRCFLGFTMRSGIHDGLVQLLGGATKVLKCWYSELYSNVGAQMLMLGTCFKCLLHVYRGSCSCSSSMCSLICIDAWLQTF